jgi:hypothetical protein
VQYKAPSYGCIEWTDIAARTTPSWHNDYEYRTKPVIIKYRTFLWFSKSCRKPVVSVVTDCGQEREPRECWEGFIRWIGDWQEVEV